MGSSKIFSGIKGLLMVVVCLSIVNLSLGQQKFCGHDLRAVIELMCPKGVNGYETKRSFSIDEDLSNENTEEDFSFGQSFDMLPFLRMMETNGIAQTRRRRDGIAHECCLKACHTSEIIKYCRK
ncbi:probable insulin-like peptide 3 [Eupeodes corollae]|uniref:probable insulin-like peptide 3 n=1 Tax=Eupeodes corollae TaxID=290404 RepID=UPI00248FC24E|nr:probable insulin-like peptide 3 [Eupeodes corollae]